MRMNPHYLKISLARFKFDKTIVSQTDFSLNKKSYAMELVDHLSRDSTAIEAREKPVRKATVKPEPKKRGRPQANETRDKPLTRIEKQAAGQSLDDMLKDLPTACDVGTKKNSKGYKESWTGSLFRIITQHG